MFCFFGYLHAFVDLNGQKDTIKILQDLEYAYIHNKAVRHFLGPLNEAYVRRAYSYISESKNEATVQFVVKDLVTQKQAMMDIERQFSGMKCFPTYDSYT